MRLRLPVSVAAAGARGLAGLGALTWRFRWAEPPGDGCADACGEASDGGPGDVRSEPARPRPTRPDGRLERAIYALWHEHLLPLAVLHSGRGAAVLASRHRDGEILARVLEGLGYLAVRGSSGRGGSAGFRALVREGRGGRPLALTPDGPRGPRRRCKPGIVRAARATGLPIVPAAAAAGTGIRLPSWDRFLVPAPGSVVYVCHGDPIHIPAGGSRAGSSDGWARVVEEGLERTVALCEARAAAGKRRPGGSRKGKERRG